MNFKKTVLMVLAGLAASAPVFGDTLTSLDNEKARVSYAIGLMLGNNFFKRQGLTTNEVDVNIFAQGIQAVEAGSTPLLTPEQAQAILKQFQQDFSVKRQQQLAEIAAKSKADGEAFLAANKSKPGVQSLADGLQYTVVNNGTGALPGPGDTVTVNYRGALIDGTEFDSSYKRGQPAQFPVGGVIRGWTEALQMMHVGSKWKLFIPSELAYGERGGPGIPPNSVLVFDVELVDTKAPAAPVAAPTPPPLTSDIIKVPSADEMKKGAKIEVIKPEDAAKLQNSAK